MENYIDLEEGATYEYLWQGLVAIGISFLFLLLHWSITLVLLPAAIGIFNIKTGVEIDVINKKIRKYKKYLGYKLGNWTSMENIILAELYYNYNTNTSKVQFRRFNDTLPASAKTFDLVFINDIGEKYIFNPFLKFGLAIKAMKTLDKMDGLDTINHLDKLIARKYKKR